MAVSRMYLVPLLAFPFLGLAACGKHPSKNLRTDSQNDLSPRTETTVYSALGGVSQSDLADDSLQYWLLCESLPRIPGIKVSAGQETIVSFSAKGLDDGLTCSLEVRGSEREDVEWLASDGLPGLYYASNKSVLKNSRLFAKLYRVHREKSALAKVQVTFEDGGLCEKFDVATYRCDDKTGASSDLYHNYGFELGDGEPSLVIAKINAASAIAKSGLSIGDRLIMIDQVKVSDRAAVATVLRNWKAKSPLPKLWLTVLRGQEAKLISVSSL